MPSSAPALASGVLGGRSRHPRTTLRARNRRLAIGTTVLLLVAALVLSDLSTASTPAYRRGALAGYLATVRRDVAACNAGLRDAVQAARAQLAHSPAIAAGVAATFADQGVAACSYTNSDLVALAALTPPAGVAGAGAQRLAPALTRWVFPAAFLYLHDLHALDLHPERRSVLRALDRAAAALAARRESAERAVRAVDRAAGVAPEPFSLARGFGAGPPGAQR